MRIVRCRGVSGQGCLSRGCLPRGCLPKGCLPGGCLPQGVGVSAHGSVCLGGVCQNPPVNRITDRCCSNEIVKFVCFRNTNLGKLQIADEITKLNVLHYVQRILNKGSLTANPLIHIYIDYLTQKMWNSSSLCEIETPWQTWCLTKDVQKIDKCRSIVRNQCAHPVGNGVLFLNQIADIGPLMSLPWLSLTLSGRILCCLRVADLLVDFLSLFFFSKSDMSHAELGEGSSLVAGD